MLASKLAVGADGSNVALHSEISASFAEAIYKMVLREKPSQCIEIGMAFGVSTLAILSALNELNSGTLISIDPFQSTHWHGAGLRAIEMAGFASRHILVEDFDYLALPELLREGRTFEFAYIDGHHTFDYVLLDCWYLDRMLLPNGVMAFNDCGYPAVNKVLRFLTTHRRYVEIDAGLPVQADPESLKECALRLLKGKRRFGPMQHQDRYFRKQEAWEPAWNFFCDF
jgi:predicted O-methyltransferase YrrM